MEAISLAARGGRRPAPGAAPMRPTSPASPLHAEFAQRLAGLRIEVLDAYERSRASVDAQLTDLIENVQQRLPRADEQGRLTAIAGQGLDLLAQARPAATRPGAKGLAHLQRLVEDLVDVVLVHSD